MYLDKERQRLTKELSLQSEALDVPEGYALPRTRSIDSTIVESTL